MGVRSLVAAGFTRAAKAFGPDTAPQAMQEAARDVSQMGPAHPFSPGEPVSPYDGYSRTPRSIDFQTSYNVATRPRTHERVSFDTLKGLIEAYDAASLCIWHRIDSIRSLDWKLLAAEHYTGDVAGAIPLGMAALKRPDRKNKFGTWLARYLYDVLAYDAGTLYRMRNMGGRCIGLKVVDGCSIAPLLDYWGDSPDPPAEAYVQYANGLPWNWLTRDDLIYEPFRPRPDSPYGHAPLESIILNANTDLRFQLYFLERFTSGNIPEAFASAPETWNPDQIEAFQAYWDSFMYGDQSRKHEIRWLPGGSTFTWSNEKDFTDAFSLFLMRKTAAAYHVVPSDLGFTETVNLSSSESQADVQHRVGDLPLINFVEAILTAFLQDDLGLPLTFNFDRGEEQEDQAAQASADGQYIDRGVVSPSEIRELRYGLSEPAGQIVPRYIFTTRGGPVPLNSLFGVAGKTDAETGAPAPGVQLPHEAFTGVEGVIPNPPLLQEPLAEQEYGSGAIPPGPPPQPTGIPVATDPAKLVAKEGEAAPGITSETGIYGDPLIRGDEDEPDAVQAVKSELAAFRRFEKARVRKGEWRDFTFGHAGRVQAHNLNDAGRLAVAKATGEIAVAGLAVQAADTGRVLMLQRALCDDDPAAGKFEMPGGHLDLDEPARAAALREWQEESGLPFPDGEFTATWTSSNGIYQGFVYTIPCEDGLDIFARQAGSDPDGDVDGTETIAWWDPADLPGNAAVRPELLADIGAVLDALGAGPSLCCGAGCCSDGCCDGTGGCTCGDPVSCTSCGYSGEGRSYVEQPDATVLCWDCDDQDDVTKAARVVKMYPEGQSYASHAFRPTGPFGEFPEGMPEVCHYCGMARSDPAHAAYREIAKAGDSGPKAQAPAGADAWAGWRLTDKAVAYWGPQVTSAVTSVLTPSLLDSAAQDYLTANPQQQGDAPGKKDRNDAAFAWLLAWLKSHDAELDLSGAAGGIAADGYLIGTASAVAALDGTTADLGDWKPGDTDAASSGAAALGAGDGLAAFLAAPGAASADALSGGVIAALARQLAGANGSDGNQGLGKTLAATVKDAALAAGVALIAACAAVGQAAKDWYSEHASTETFQWVTDPTLMNCPICLDNEAAEPRQFGEPWPSGDDAPPIHDRCGCALVP